MKPHETVLVYIEQNESYLLIHKQKKDMNEGKYLGVGGKIEQGETKEEALIRETLEETGLILLDYAYRGIIHFHSGEYLEIMHLYTSNQFMGILSTSSEGNLVWVPKKALKSLPMWAGDHYFLDYLEQSQSFFSMHLYYEGEKLIQVLLDPSVSS